ncbi:MAG: hypothetical protein IKN16_06710 [Selenomonadaceae bacterium]|nr:hypothetical protein [Selenomonadaceae bacterium]MBR6888121.1 hypothetical protein [Selenomonadaceae bacterium]
MSLPLKVFTLEVDAATNSISPHVRYISPDNILHDLYRILNCQLVTCTEIEVNGKFFDVWSDDEALLKPNPVPNLYIDDDLIIFGSVAFAKSYNEGKLVGLERDDLHLLWDFAQVQFPKLLDFIARQRRHF